VNLIVAASALIEISMATISSVWSLDKHLPEIIQFTVAVFLMISVEIWLVFLLHATSFNCTANDLNACNGAE
jgi:hypothetical protein